MTAVAIASSIEAGVLVAHHRATARPHPKEKCTITGGETQRPTTGKRVLAYLSGSNSNQRCVYSRSPPPCGVWTYVNPSRPPVPRSRPYH
ncbi:hypothetical protein AVEN_1032-1 [Araneus ventricosus]|uniref:Uncharacterized protein n=1 Tax=Araneus ventricosus TaxID=182803 RepID=A0A4Y2L0Q6_ARAVE|nr:hypothetical protein AVEN_1032-1 [Araneus ventricosus]